MLKKTKLYMFLLCLLAYSSAYLCRINFSAIMPELKFFTESQLGIITSIFFLTYGLGQLVNGVLGDRVSPVWLLFIGIFGSGTINFAMSFFYDFYAVSFLWGFNGFFQSMLWSPIISIIAKYYNAKEKNKFAKYFSISVPIGTLLAYGLSALWIVNLGWQYAFSINGGLLIVISAVWLLLSKKLLKQLKRGLEIDAENQKVPKCNNKNESLTLPESTNATSKSFKVFLHSFFISGLIILILPIAIHGALKDSVTTWVPKFMAQMFGTTTSLSLVFTMILPIVNATGGFIAISVNNRIKNEVASTAIFFCVAVISSSVLMFFGKYSIYLSIICLAIITNCMFAINTLTITLIPLHFLRFKRVGTVSGTLNSLSYLGCALVNVLVGFIITAFSWQSVMLFWVILATSALVLCIISSFMWQKFCKNERKLLVQ